MLVYNVDKFELTVLTDEKFRKRNPTLYVDLIKRFIRHFDKRWRSEAGAGFLH